MTSSNLDIDKYTPERARHYEAHHRKSLRTALTTWRERSLLARALKLSGNPKRVVDLPCGTGRFWPAFEAAGVKQLLAADNSEGMLSLATAMQPTVSIPVTVFKTSVFAIELPDADVEVMACMRFFHHLARSEDRLKALAEVRRVVSGHAVISLWTNGCLQSMLSSRRKLKGESTEGYGKRTCIDAATFEQEAVAAGFVIVGRWRLWPGLSMWTFYLLRKA